MTLRERFGRATVESRTGALLAETASRSRVVSTVGDLLDLEYPRDMRSWRTGSTAARIVGSWQRRLDRIVAGAAVFDALNAIGGWIRSSALYRWLTAEPEPEVIVIDLRETVTVRPFLIAIDESIGVVLLGRRTSIVAATAGGTLEKLCEAPVRVLSFVALFGLLVSTAIGVVTGMVGSTGVWIRAVLVTVALAGTRIDASWETIRESWPVQAAIALLEPPKPPARDDRDPESLEANDRGPEPLGPNGRNPESANREE